MNDKDLLSIRKFSAFTGIEQSTLRYYDEIGLFSPARREKNGYRYYSPTQMITVNLIGVLGRLNFSLKHISELKEKRTPEGIMDLLEQQEFELDMELRRLRKSYSVIHVFRKLIKEGLQADPNRISVEKLKGLHFVLGDANHFEEGDKAFYRNYIRFCDQAKRLRIDLDYPIGGYFESMERFLQSPSLPTHFFSIDPSGHEKREAGRYLTGYARGYYGEMGDLPQRMAAHAKANSLIFTGPVHVIYLHDEIGVSSPENYLAQVTVPVSEQMLRRNPMHISGTLS
jgi:DNA-binding transcriptional MerR regulator